MFIPYRLEIESPRRPWLVESLASVIAVCALFRGDAIFFRWGFKPVDPSIVEATTSMFLHAHWLHLGGNLLFLLIFGRGLERALGPLKAGAIYLLSGWAGALAHWAFVVDYASDEPAIGASAAISGVIGAAAVVLPAAPVQCIYFSFGSWAPVRIGIPAAVFAIGWFFLQVFVAVFLGASAMGVAFWAHVGGFAAGAALATAIEGLPMLRRRRRREAQSRALEEAFAAGTTAPAPDEATPEERWAAGERRPPEGAVAAAAYLSGDPGDWDGRETLRAVAAFAQLGHPGAAAGALAEFLARAEGDASEPELLAQGARLLKRLGRHEAAAAFAAELKKRHPDSMQAREYR